MSFVKIIIESNIGRVILFFTSLKVWRYLRPKSATYTYNLGWYKVEAPLILATGERREEDE